MNNYKIVVINPGSTSTKVSYHENEKMIFSTDVFHDSSVLLKFPTINDQLDYRLAVIEKFLKSKNIDMNDIDAIVGRGGGCYSVESGIYEINEQLIEDTRAAKGGLYHSSMLGVQLANELHKRYGGRMFMMDPPVVDELCDLARITGVKGVYRRAVSHALNLKATAKHHAKVMGKKYEDCRFIVCHIDGGISITAHLNGRMIDGNDAGGGEGPFTPTRMGSMAVTDMNNRLNHLSHDEIRNLCSQAGGLSSHFGTSNSNKIHAEVEAGNPEYTLVWNAMLYQVCKWIGSMAAVLEGKVDAIVLTGGLMRFKDVEETVKKRCGWIAPVAVYPGEMEQTAMADGALEVLRGETEPKEYTGRPVWSGFDEKRLKVDAQLRRPAGSKRADEAMSDSGRRK
ncbi:MAG: butyrate kinase [Anaerovoracaceae bacterium]